MEQQRFYNPHHPLDVPEFTGGARSKSAPAAYFNNFAFSEEFFYEEGRTCFSAGSGQRRAVGALGSPRRMHPATGWWCQMSQEEYAAYNNAETQTTPAAKAAAFEAYLKAYPNSAVKADALQQMLFAYSQANDAREDAGCGGPSAGRWTRTISGRSCLK